MDSTPPSLRSDPPHRSKSASRLALTVSDLDLGSNPEQIPHFSVEIAPPTDTETPSKPSLPLRDLLLLSPSSPARRSTRTRLSDRLEAGEDPVAEHVGNRRRCRARTNSVASPRNTRRSRRRLEVEVREEREIAAAATADEAAKPKKRRCNVRSKKEKLPVAASAVLSTTKDNEGDQCAAVNGFVQLMSDLIMWRDVAKSSLWFGFGCLFFMSSSFTHGLSYSFFSVVSQMGLLYLGVSFLSSSLLQRKNKERVGECKLKEEDLLRLGRVVLPPMNFVLSKSRVLFSGEPSMTLKVAIILLVGAEYGHLLTLWRLCVIGFFASFSIPKLYSLYAPRIDIIVENGKSWLLETWRSCSRKKAVVGLVATAFWNMSSIKTRTFAAFLSLVILQYVRQNSKANSEGEEESITTEDPGKKLQ